MLFNPEGVKSLRITQFVSCGAFLASQLCQMPRAQSRGSGFNSLDGSQGGFLSRVQWEENSSFIRR